MSKIVKIKLIERKGAWNGFLRYSNTKDYISPYFDSTGTIYTGLEIEDEKRLATVLKQDLSPISDFWHDFKIPVNGTHPIYLNLRNPEHELQYLFALNHKRVAQSVNDPKFGIKDYVIEDEDKEAEVINAKAELEIKAVSAYTKMSLDNKRDVLKLYPGFVNMDSMSPTVIESKLYELMKKDPATFIRHSNDKNRDTKLLIKDLVKANIFRKNKTSYYYGDDFIGHDEESAVSYIDDPARQSLKIDLMAQLSNIKK